MTTRTAVTIVDMKLLSDTIEAAKVKTGEIWQFTRELAGIDVGKFEHLIEELYANIHEIELLSSTLFALAKREVLLDIIKLQERTCTPVTP